MMNEDAPLILDNFGDTLVNERIHIPALGRLFDNTGLA
jgi:hypothetical protein